MEKEITEVLVINILEAVWVFMIYNKIPGKMKRDWELIYLNSKLKIQTMTHTQDAKVF